MRLEYQVAIAFGADLVFGDPRWIPHPVKLIGALAGRLENPLRRLIPKPRVAGVVIVGTVLSVTGAAAWILLHAARLLHPVVGDVVSILLLYTCLATRDLARHSYRVYRALKDGDLVEARRRVSMMVGRDTDQMDVLQVVRATVESVAENLVDGVTAPIFFAVLGGPAGALLYKAVNTLDSTFGYKNERYFEFGWASARLDDVVNYLPSRLTAPLVCVAGALVGLKPLSAWRICLRDGRKHPSPNSGLAEAAVAGALGVQLGGLNYYQGRPSERPRMGDSCWPLQPHHILSANALMLAASSVTLLVFLGMRAGLLAAWQSRW